VSVNLGEGAIETDRIYTGKKGDSSVKQVSSMVDIPRFQFHIGIFELYYESASNCRLWADRN
jgi:hypothetical protein